MSFLFNRMSVSFCLTISKAFVALLLVFITASKVSIAAEAPTVLLLNSYHSQFLWTAELTQGVQDELTSKGMAKNLYVEYMDSRRFVDDANYERQLGELLKYKYLQYEPDIVITSDDHAFYFMVEYGQEFFPDKPIVFSGVNVFKEETIADRNNIVGIQEGMEIEGNLELILKLQPDTKRIVLLGDRTGLGLRMVEKAKSIKANWSESQDRKPIQIEIWDDFSLAQLNKQASQMKPGTVFLMLAIHKDTQGNYFSFEEELPRLAENSAVPIYGMWGALMIGNGVIGGMMNDPYQHGRQAASVATSVLAGEPMDQIGVLEKAKFSPQFDFDVLDRFGIDLRLLPEESKVFNRPLSLYEKHHLLINGLLALVVFLSVVISILIVSIRKRVIAQQQLATLNAELESIVDERTKDLDDRNKQLERTSKQMEELAYTDNLTGISNRRSGNKEVKSYIQRYQISGEALSVALIDIDYFKSINDTLGHKLGDEVLCKVVNKISQGLRPSDRLYRWGGDEFLVALPQTNLEAAETVCERMCEEVRTITLSELNGVTLSIGLTSFRDGDDFDTILVRADRALYDAKERGRNQTRSV